MPSSRKGCSTHFTKSQICITYPASELLIPRKMHKSDARIIQVLNEGYDIWLGLVITGYHTNEDLTTLGSEGNMKDRKDKFVMLQREEGSEVFYRLLQIYDENIL